MHYFTTILYWYVLVVPQKGVFPPSPFPQPFIPGFVPSTTYAHMLAHGERLEWMNLAHTRVCSLHQYLCWGYNTEDCPGMKMQPGNGMRLVAGETSAITFSHTQPWLCWLAKLWNDILWNAISAWNITAKQERLVVKNQNCRNYCLKKQARKKWPVLLP